jgi:hypothetical protein
VNPRPAYLAALVTALVAFACSARADVCQPQAAQLAQLQEPAHPGVAGT